MTTDPKCEVCGAFEVVGVAAVPGVPISVAYCHTCLHAGVAPLKIVITQTALNNGYENSANWWQELVDRTLKYLNYRRDLFDERVKSEVDEIERLSEQYRRREAELQDVPMEVYDAEAQSGHLG